MSYCTIDDNNTGPEIAWSAEKCVTTINDAISERCIPKLVNFVPGNFAKFTTNGQIVDSKIRLDDTQKGLDILWSADKINSEILNKVGKCITTGDHLTPRKFLQYKDGRVISSEYYVADDEMPSTNVLYSSKKWNSMLENTFNDFCIKKLPSDTKNGLLVVTGTGGNLTTKDYFISDEVSTDKNLWSAAKTEDYVNTTVSNLYGTKLQETNVKIDEQNKLISNLQTQFNEKLDKVPGVFPDNLAIFDGGNLKDSRLRIDDFALPSPDVVWSSQKIDEQMKSSGLSQAIVKPSVYATNNLPVFDVTGNLIDSRFTINDNQYGNNVLWSSEKQENEANKIKIEFDTKANKINSNVDIILRTKMDKLDLTPNTLLQTDSTGTKLTNSNFVVDDSAPAGPNIIWTSEKWNVNKFANIQDVGNSRNLISFDGNSKLIDSGYRVDDTCDSDKCLWTVDRIKKELGVGKFYMSGIIIGNLTIDSNLWYTPQFTITTCSLNNLIGSSQTNFAMPKVGYFYQTVNGVLINGLPSNEMIFVEMQFKSGNVTNFGINSFNVVFSSVDLFNLNELFSVKIKTKNSGSQITTSLDYPLRFQLMEI